MVVNVRSSVMAIVAVHSICWNMKATMKLIVLMILLAANCAHGMTATENVGCQWMKVYYDALGFDARIVPDHAIIDSQSTCGLHTPSCCTRAMENELKLLSHASFISEFSENVMSLKEAFESAASRFDVSFMRLLNSTKSGLHRMLGRTYGLLYQQNADLLLDLFRDFRDYYKTNSGDLADAIEMFFSALFQRMFTIFNPQYEHDDHYLDCVEDNFERIRPFGSVPKQLASHIERTFFATRTFARGLAAGRNVLLELAAMNRSLTSNGCLTNITQLQYCSHCNGLKLLKPCHDACVSVFNGCLHSLTPVIAEWNLFLGELIKLAELLEGPLNIENVIRPIEIKFSDAFVRFKDNVKTVFAKITEYCGPLTSENDQNRQKRAAARNPASTKQLSNSRKSGTPLPTTPLPVVSINLTSLVKEIRTIQLLQAVNFWCLLPNTVCTNINSSVDVDCWSGHIVKRNVVTSSNAKCQEPADSEHHSTVYGSGSSAVRKLVQQLRDETAKLRSARWKRSSPQIEEEESDDEDNDDEESSGVEDVELIPTTMVSTPPVSSRSKTTVSIMYAAAIPPVNDTDTATGRVPLDSMPIQSNCGCMFAREYVFLVYVMIVTSLAVL